MLNLEASRSKRASAWEGCGSRFGEPDLLNPIDSLYAKARRLADVLGLPHKNIAPFATSTFTEDERNASDLHRLFYGHDGPIVHKWKHYLSLYERHLSRFRGKPFQSLEIGVFEGGSMALWRSQ